MALWTSTAQLQHRRLCHLSKPLGCRPKWPRYGVSKNKLASSLPRALSLAIFSFCSFSSCQVFSIAHLTNLKSPSWQTCYLEERLLNVGVKLHLSAIRQQPGKWHWCMYVSVILLMLKLESSTRYVKLWITSFLWLCGLFVLCLTVCICAGLQCSMALVVSS